MNEWMIVLIAGCIVFTTFTVEGVAGFGSTVMALPFVSMLIGIDKAVPLLSSMSVLLSIFIVLRSWRNVDLKEYGFILLHVIPGVPVGLFFMEYLPKAALIGLLDFFRFFVGGRGLYNVFKKPLAPPLIPVKKGIGSRFILFIGGIIQGAFSSGGPIVVMYASKAITEKSKFRAILSSLWLTTNTVMVTKWTLSGKVWTPQLGKMLLCILPFILCGMIFGDFLHNKVDQKKFTLLVYSVLIIAAFMLSGNLIRNIIIS